MVEESGETWAQRIKSVIVRRKQPEVKGPSEEELRTKAFRAYCEHLSSSGDNGVQKFGEYLGGIFVENLAYDFTRARQEKPDLTVGEFLSERSRRSSHTEIAGSGWNPDDSLMRTWASHKHDKGWGVLTSSGIADLLNEEGWIDKDERFKKSDRTSFDSIAYVVKSPWGGKQDTHGSFSEWWAGVSNPEIRQAGILVGLKREDKYPAAPHTYFTGEEGGVRGFAIRLENKTLSAIVG